MSNVAGFLLIDKPESLGSFACIAKIRSLLPSRPKVGHAGTLDRFATGLLIIGISRNATRHMHELITLDKIYTATGKWGEATDTLDHTGNVVETISDNPLTKSVLKKAAQAFEKEYEQTPPVYSALKYEGQRLSDIARKSIDPQLMASIAAAKKRAVHIFSIEIIDINPPFFTIRAHVSHGTYIRSLIDDIARYAGSCATTYALRREAIGPFKISQAVSLDELLDRDAISKHLIPVDQMMENIESYKQAHQK